MERNIRNFLLLSCSLLLTHTSCSYAESYLSRNDTFELRLSAGYLMGESSEYVYDAYGLSSGIPGYKISQLDWKINNAYMAGIGATYSPIKRFRFNVDYWRDAVDGQSTLDDYDWFYVGKDWSNWSRTDATAEISNVNVNGEFAFLQLDEDQTDFTVLLGYKRDHLSWVGVGGQGIYSISSFRDSYVTFPDIPVITYEQNYTTPYIGFGVHTANDSKNLPIILSANILYSKWAHGEDSDTHLLRSLSFERSGNGNWLATNISLDFFLTQKIALTLAYDYQNYSEIKSNDKITDLTTGSITELVGPYGGFDHNSNMVSTQLSYRF